MIRTANLTASISRNAGGLFESVRRLVQSLAATGMEVHVFGVRDEFSDVDAEAWKPVVVKAFDPLWPEQFGFSPRFVEELLAFDPDITHTHGIWVYPSVATNVFSNRKHRPYLISAHGMLDPWAVRNSRWKKAIAYVLYEGSHLRGARCLRALCESEARAIRELGLKNDIAIIPNGIDAPAGPPQTPAPWDGLVEPGRKVLLYLGRIHPKKGIANLIKAWANLRNSQLSTPGSQLSNWVLAIAGWDQGGHEQELKQLATSLGLSWTELQKPTGNNGSLNTDHRLLNTAHSHAAAPSVLFLGPQFNEAKAACYHFCDGFVLSSFSEGVPMTVLEAWVNSKPVIMTPQCNLPEGFSSGAAIKVETAPESVAEGLRELLLMSDAERLTMGERAYALATERFAWPRLAQQMKSLYEWMLGAGPKPGCLADF